MTTRILVAGVGNIFLGDDGFGVEVAQRLMRRQFPDAVRVADFGIRGFELAYALMDEYDAIVLIDAVPRGGVPGTLYTIQPDLSALDSAALQGAAVETHGMNPMKVLAMVQTMGARPKRLLLVGCEPESCDGETEERLGLSQPVAAAVQAAVERVEAIVEELLDEHQVIATPVASQLVT
jgi:hydrogenase maturation protease